MAGWIIAALVPFVAGDAPIVPGCPSAPAGSLPHVAAAGQDKKAEKVKVTVVVILASEKGATVDKQLKSIAKEIRKLNPQLKSFRLKTMMNRSLAPEEKATFDLVEQKRAVVVVKHGADSENRVGVVVTAPDQGEIEYRTVCGKFLPIVTRYQTKGRERLILAIRVQPCMGD